VSEFWRQCTLQKDRIHTVVWIQEWAAKKGAIIKSSADNELNGYTVMEVGSQRMPEQQVKQIERMYKKFKDGGSLANQKDS
jgi:hypothetical protein